VRLAVGLLLLLAGLLILSRLGSLLAPVVLAALLSYVLYPLVNRLNRRMPRGLAVLVVYLVLIAVAVGASTGLGIAVSEQVTGLVEDLRQLSTEIPAWLQDLSNLTIRIGPWTLDLGAANLDPLLSSLGSSVSPLVSRAGGVLASVAAVTATAVGTVLAAMVLGFYMLLSSESLDRALVGLVPPAYQRDVQRLARETGEVWNAFVRGQLLLSAVIGVGVTVVLTVLGVRFSLVLGLVAGLLEFVPMFGPAVAGLIAVLVALIQGANWWGLSPAALGLAVAIAFVIIQQIENNVLVPRIIGHTLNLPPLFVLLGALAGGALAGVLGLLLAAPVLATMRPWLGYIYRKVVGLETWPQPVLLPPPARPPVLKRMQKRVTRRSRAKEDNVKEPPA
jgi:predicted PurR-regulated permease PerM